MANTYKNIVITPNRSSNTADPKVVYSGGNTTANTDITLNVYPDSNGTLSWEGSAGQLFSITNDLSNNLFGVNDVSGIPSLEVYANGLVSIAPFGGNVVIGNTAEFILSPGTGLHANGSFGTAGQVLHSNGSAVYWAADDNAGGTVTSVASANGIGGGTITTSGTLYAVAGNSTVFVNSSGIHVNTAALPADGVTSVATGSGLTGGTITATGTVSVLANNGITANTTGLFVTQGTGTVVNSSGVHVTNVPNAITFNNGGAGAASGSTYTGSSTLTVSYNTVGAPSTSGTNASGTWSININGSAASATNASAATNATFATTAGSAPNPNAITFNNGGAGAASGSTYTGSATLTVSYNTVGAPSTTGTNASGTWSISINGSAASATNASAATNATTATNWGTYGAVPAAGASGGTPSTIPRSDVNGYTYFGYINSGTSNSENPAVSQVIVTNGTDNFYRKSAIASFTTYLSGTASSLTAGAATNASFATNATSATNASYQGPTGTSNDWVTSFQNTPAHYTSFREMSANGPSGTWWFMENMRHSNGSNYWGRQNAWGWEDNANEYYSRNISGGTFGSWVRFLNSSNYNSYAPTLTGTGASGTWSININGSAASATNASAATNATTATNQSGGTVSATTGSFSSDLSFNSGYGSAAVAYGCRAWIRFVVSAGVPAISNDGNVSTITDNGVGNFVINFTTALVDANYAAVANYSVTNSATGGSNDGQASCHTYATGSVRIFVADGSGGAQDPQRCSLIVCR